MTIMVTLGAMMIPALRPALEGRRIREGARTVNVYLSAARNRAVEIGRPVGLIFDRDPNLADASIVMRQAEVPPPYAGDWEDSRLAIQLVSGTTYRIWFCHANGTASFEHPFPKKFGTLDIDPNGEGIIGVRDLFQVDYKGAPWQINAILQVDNPAIPTWRVQFAQSDLRLLQATATQPIYVPYQFSRSPVPNNTPPIRLPAQTVVDLSSSGTDGTLQFTSSALVPVAVMFSPTGAVQNYFYNNTALLPTSPAYFMVGRRERVPLSGGSPPVDDGLLNYQDPNNLWVSVNPQSGLVTTSDVAAGANLAASRRFAQEHQRIGGR